MSSPDASKNPKSPTPPRAKRRWLGPGLAITMQALACVLWLYLLVLNVSAPPTPHQQLQFWLLIGAIGFVTVSMFFNFLVWRERRRSR